MSSPDRRADDQSPAPTPDPEQPAQPAWKGWAVGTVVCLLASPFVLPLGWKLVEQRVMPVGHLTTAKAKGRFPGPWPKQAAHQIVGGTVTGRDPVGRDPANRRGCTMGHQERADLKDVAAHQHRRHSPGESRPARPSARRT